MTFLKFQTHLLYDSTISIFGRSNVQSAIDKFFSSAVVRHWYCFNEFIITRTVGFGPWFWALDSGFPGPRSRFRNKTQPECQKHVTNYKYNWAPFGKPMLKMVSISSQTESQADSNLSKTDPYHSDRDCPNRYGKYSTGMFILKLLNFEIVLKIGTFVVIIR